jgi:hypothetical protein
MLLIIATGIACLVGLYSLVDSARKAPTLNIDEDGFRDTDTDEVV